jgi:serine/threonine protein phosphatase PrpC
VKVLRVAHRGRVLAHGFFFGRPLGEEEARARVLGRWRAGATVRRVAGGLALLLPEPEWTRAEAAPGAPLVRYGPVLSTAPLEDAELAALAVPEAVVIARGGVARAHPPRAEDEEDPARWLDVSEVLVLAAASLGAPPPAPRVIAPPPPVDVRAALGAPPASAEVPAMLAALKKLHAGEKVAAGGKVRGGAGAHDGTNPLGGAALAVLGRVARMFAAVLGLFGNAVGGSGSAGPAGTSSRALAAMPAAPSGPSWLDRMRARALDAAARMLVLARLARFFERAHARYLSKMIDMFERGDLEDALRHAIPLDGDAGPGGPPALLPGGPRSDLSISPWRAPARGALGLGGGLFQDLRAMYRRAFERLVAMGAIDRAAFVLAELLNSNEEAVSFLERHGRFLLAAQIAEARGLPPGLVVRQWLLAGDAARAVAIARAKGAFADAVARLERAGPPYDRPAAALRLKWADLLAESGAYAAAVDVVWKLEDARPLARAWLDRAILAGGATAGTMLAKKATLPETFGEVRAAVLALLADPEPEAEAARVAFATGLVEGPTSPETRVLARPTARAMLDPLARDRRKGAGLAERLAELSGEAALRADVRPLVAAGRAPHVRVTSAAMTETGARTVNEDAVDFGAPNAGGRNTTGGPLTPYGFFLHVLDGTGGGERPRHPAAMAADAVFETLSRDARGGRSRDALARDLYDGVREANRRIFEGSTRDVRMRGMGSSSTCAALVDGALVVAQVGDTRAYMIRGGRFEQLTRDDSLVEAYREKQPTITPEELATLPQNIITKCLGTAADVAPRLSLVPLQRGDMVLLTTDGVHTTLPAAELAAVACGAQGPADCVRKLRTRLIAAGAMDNFSAIAARFDGADLPDSLPPGPWASPYEPAPSSLAGPTAAPLATLEQPLVHTRPRADCGALAIHDAARLPDGRIVVALGEIGARLLSPSGKTLAEFGEPAHHLVVSTHGDRAILVAARGDAWRLAKVDLAGKRVRAWCDARIDRFVPSFDGARLFCSRGRRVFAVDAISDGWDALWDVTVDGGDVTQLSLDPSELRVVVSAGPGDHVVWRYDLEAMTLRAKAAATEPPRFGWSWTASAEVLELCDASGAPRLRVILRGAKAPRARVDGPELLAFDDCGRLLVLSAKTGRIVRELRLSP